jgi:hypothetical protein
VNFNAVLNFDPGLSFVEDKVVQQILIYVLRAGDNTKYVDGGALVKLASGRLALVPGSTQKGDTICAYHGNFVIGQFVCRQYLGRNDIETNIREKFQSIATGEQLYSRGEGWTWQNLKKGKGPSIWQS